MIYVLLIYIFLWLKSELVSICLNWGIIMQTKNFFLILMTSISFSSMQASDLNLINSFIQYQMPKEGKKAYNLGWSSGYATCSEYRKNDAWDAVFIGGMLVFFIGAIAWLSLDEIQNKNRCEKEEAKTALQIFNIIDNELCELKKVCNKEIPLAHSTLQNYLGNINIMNLSHLKKTGFYN